MKTSKFDIRLALSILLALFLLSACDDVELQSKWPSVGANEEKNEVIWSEDGHYFDLDSMVLLTVMNDADNLYVRMMTRHQQTKMLILRAGFTLWIDSLGNSEKNFGVHFPLPKQKGMGRSSSDHKARTGFDEILEDSQYTLALLDGPGQNRQTMPTTKAEERGIYPRLRMEKNYLIYELKVPLRDVEKDGVVSLGFESGKLAKRSGVRGGQGGGKGGGRVRGGGGGGGGGGKKMGANQGTYGKSMPKPIEIWAKVYLADPPQQ